jgi:hypothetical protein
MVFVRQTLVLLVLGTLAALPLGCGGKSAVDPDTQLQNSELSEIYDSYFTFNKRTGHPPKQLSDLNTKEFQAVSGGVGLQAVKDGKYVIVWSVDVSGKDPGKVVAYEKNAPTSGGAVVTADGIVKKMTAEQVQAALPKK